MRADHVEARDGFVTYDELKGPDLDAARWSPARLPLPRGDMHIPLDPNAQLAVGEGEVRVTIPHFSLSHDRFQAADSAKYLILSTRQFELPPDQAATFAADLAVTNIGGEPGDYRRAMAAFQVSSRRTRTSTTTSPGCARARSRSTGAGLSRLGASTATRCTRLTALSSPNGLASDSGSGRCCQSGTVGADRSMGRA
jgi:hypothetical protein